MTPQTQNTLDSMVADLPSWTTEAIQSNLKTTEAIWTNLNNDEEFRKLAFHWNLAAQKELEARGSN